jgi:hypothetical protein
VSYGVEPPRNEEVKGYKEAIAPGLLRGTFQRILFRKGTGRGFWTRAI